MNLRLKHGAATATVSLPDSGATVADLFAEAHKQFGVSHGEIAFYAGFPPKAINVSDVSASLASVGVRSGQQIDVRKEGAGSAAAAPAAAVAAPAPASAAAPAAAVPAPAAARPATSWSCAACTFANPPHLTACEVCGTARAPAAAASGAGTSGAGAVGSAAGSASGSVTMERHVVPADNSCLFTSVGWAAYPGHRMDRAPELRRAVRDYILAHPATFTAAILEKPPAEYASWIMDKDHWGGGIECNVFASMLRMEVVAVDIKTAKALVFGEGAGYTQRVFLLYDGIHYDAMFVKAAAAAGHGGAPTSVFAVADAAAMASAVALAAKLQRERAFTDMANFTLQCGICYKGLKGQAEALAHARTTGHTNFAEYNPDLKR